MREPAQDPTAPSAAFLELKEALSRRPSTAKQHVQIAERLLQQRMVADVQYVYFVQARDGGPIKIGRSQDPRRRLLSLQISHPEPLVLRRTVPVHKSLASRLERRLHQFFEASRIHGEWFRASDDLAELGHAIPEDSAGLDRLIGDLVAP